PGRYNLTGDLFQRILEDTGELPSGLDYAYVALDSPEAGKHSRAKARSVRMQELAQEIKGLSEEDWYKTLAGGVQYSLRPLVSPVPDGHPAFARTDAWAKKSVNTALGAWVGLSHDLFVYQKHAMFYADGGGGWGGFSGYVEPNPEFFSRLAHSIRLLSGRLKESGFFDRLREATGEDNYRKVAQNKTRDVSIVCATDKHYEAFRSILEAMVEMSRKELESQPFEEGEHDILKQFAETLRWLTFDVGDAPDHKDKSLICDVATEYLSGQCLEVATGRPFVIVAIVPRGGKLYLSKGSIFSYYEFARPAARRMTDSEWRKTERDVHDSWLGTQGCLAKALKEIHDPKVLTEYLKDDNPNVRASTARRLIELKAVKTFPAIVQLLGDDTEIPGTRSRFHVATVASVVERSLYDLRKAMGPEADGLIEEFILSTGADAPVNTRWRALRLVSRLPEGRKRSPRIREYVTRRSEDPDGARYREQALRYLERYPARLTEAQARKYASELAQGVKAKIRPREWRVAEMKDGRWRLVQDRPAIDNAVVFFNPDGSDPEASKVRDRIACYHTTYGEPRNGLSLGITGPHASTRLRTLPASPIHLTLHLRKDKSLRLPAGCDGSGRITRMSLRIEGLPDVEGTTSFTHDGPPETAPLRKGLLGKGDNTVGDLLVNPIALLRGQKPPRQGGMRPEFTVTLELEMHFADQNGRLVGDTWKGALSRAEKVEIYPEDEVRKKLRGPPPPEVKREDVPDAALKVLESALNALVEELDELGRKYEGSVDYEGPVVTYVVPFVPVDHKGPIREFDRNVQNLTAKQYKLRAVERVTRYEVVGHPTYRKSDRPEYAHRADVRFRERVLARRSAEFVYWDRRDAPEGYREATDAEKKTSIWARIGPPGMPAFYAGHGTFVLGGKIHVLPVPAKPYVLSEKEYPAGLVELARKAAGGCLRAKRQESTHDYMVIFYYSTGDRKWLPSDEGYVYLGNRE
ncbi:MAG: DUF3160 domain-containing protein, partial [Planctomycetota bacterium]